MLITQRTPDGEIPDIAGVRDRYEDIAERYNGEYDGWGVALDENP